MLTAPRVGMLHTLAGGGGWGRVPWCAPGPGMGI